jgi:drug/metabolite transporter (DMT)-like permease
MKTHPYYLTICFALLIAAGSWGLFWIPQRAFESNGLTGGWASIAQMYVPFLIMLPFALYRKLDGKSFGLDYPFIGLLMGGGIAFYANSFLLTDVVRALILFYMTPVWATIFELIFLRQKIHWGRGVSLILALSGVWIVFSQGFSFPFPQNVGDWVAIIGGMLFAGGAVRIDIIQPKNIFSLLLSFFFFGGLVTVIFAILFGNVMGPIPSYESLLTMLPWLVLISLVFLIPTNIVILWSPSIIGAGLYSIIILSEIVVGTASAALFANEMFGWREGVGSLLILAAGISEVAIPYLQSNKSR